MNITMSATDSPPPARSGPYLPPRGPIVPRIPVAPTQVAPAGALPVAPAPVPEQAEPLQAEPRQAEPLQAEPLQAESLQAEPFGRFEQPFAAAPVFADPGFTDPGFTDPFAAAPAGEATADEVEAAWSHTQHDATGPEHEHELWAHGDDGATPDGSHGRVWHEMHLDTSGPRRLLRTRFVESALATTHVALAVIGALAAIQMFMIWQQLRERPASSIPHDWLDSLDQLGTISIAVGACAGVVQMVWTLMTAINARRITLFAPHWLPLVLGWALGPAVMALGLRLDGEDRLAFFLLGVLVMSVMSIISLAVLRTSVVVVIGDASPVNHWLLAIVLGSACWFWVGTHVTRSSDAVGYVRNATFAQGIGVALELGLAFLAYRAARHVREGFDTKRRLGRIGHTSPAPKFGPSLVSMHRPRGVLLIALLVALLSSTGAVGGIYRATRPDQPFPGPEVVAGARLLAVVPASFALLMVGWWTIVTGRNAAAVERRRYPWLAGFSCFAPWLGVPVAVFVGAHRSGNTPLVAAGLAAVLAMVGHAKLADAASCRDMRYIAWGFLVFRITVMVGDVLRFRRPREVTYFTEAQVNHWEAAAVVSGWACLFMLLFLVRIHRSLGRIEMAVRRRKDELAPDVCTVIAASAGSFAQQG